MRRRGGGWKNSSISSEAPSRTMVWSTVVLLVLAAACLAGCSDTAILPTSTRGELRAQCIRDGGQWLSEDSRSGYCEHEM